MPVARMKRPAANTTEGCRPLAAEVPEFMWSEKESSALVHRDPVASVAIHEPTEAMVGDELAQKRHVPGGREGIPNWSWESCLLRKCRRIRARVSGLA